MRGTAQDAENTLKDDVIGWHFVFVVETVDVNIDNLREHETTKIDH